MGCDGFRYHKGGDGARFVQAVCMQDFLIIAEIIIKLLQNWTKAGTGESATGQRSSGFLPSGKTRVFGLQSIAKPGKNDRIWKTTTSHRKQINQNPPWKKPK